MTTRHRLTLAGPTDVIEGVGIHTGTRGRVQILPAEDWDAGIVFKSAKTGERVRATAASVVDTRRCTVLGSGGVTVQTVEHLLSACSGMGVTDATIIVDGPELPILDGSALMFAEALDAAGMVELPSYQPLLTLDSPKALTMAGATIIAYPAESYSVSIIIDYPNRSAIGVQAAVYFGVNYKSEFAPARTYGFLSELDSLRRQGLAKGAAFDTGIALSDDGSADPRTPFRFVNELARHKLLDVIGDLSLIGKALRAGIVAIRPSHALATRFAGLLAAADHDGERTVEE